MFCGSQKGFLIATTSQLGGSRPVNSSHLSLGWGTNVTVHFLYIYCCISWLCLCFCAFALFIGLEGSRSDGVRTSSTEPFCGRFSLGQLGHLILIPEAADKGYQLDRYPYVSVHLHVSVLGMLGLFLGLKTKIMEAQGNDFSDLYSAFWADVLNFVGTSPSSDFCIGTWGYYGNVYLVRSFFSLLSQLEE